MTSGKVSITIDLLLGPSLREGPQAGLRSQRGVTISQGLYVIDSMPIRIPETLVDLAMERDCPVLLGSDAMHDPEAITMSREVGVNVFLVDFWAKPRFWSERSCWHCRPPHPLYVVINV